MNSHRIASPPAGQNRSINRQIVLQSLRSAGAALICLVGVVRTASVSADAWVTRMLSTHDHDFGTVVSGSPAQYRFAVKNVYAHEIELSHVRSSCGCTTAQLEHPQLRPGETGYILADFNTRSFSGPHESTLTLEATWNDHGVPRTGEASVTVRGTIRGHTTVEPAEVDFADVAFGTAATQNLRLTAHALPHYCLKCVTSSSDSSAEALSEPQRSPAQVIYDLFIRLGSQAPTGRIHEQLVVVPADEAEPRIPVDVVGRILPIVWAAPEVLFLGDVPAASQSAKRLVVRSQTPCRILGVRFDQDELPFNISRIDSLRQILEVSLPTGSELGSWRKPVVISTDAGKPITVMTYATVTPVGPTVSAAASKSSD